MKNRISDTNDLERRIKELESLQVELVEEIKLSFRELADTVSPSNIIKSAMRSVISSPELRSTMIDTAISTGAGLLGRKLVVRGSDSIMRKVAGTAVQFFLSNFVRNKIPEVKENIAARTNGVEH